MRPFWLHQHRDAEIVLLFFILFPPVTRNLSSPDIFFFHCEKGVYRGHRAGTRF